MPPSGGPLHHHVPVIPSHLIAALSAFALLAPASAHAASAPVAPGAPAPVRQGDFFADLPKGGDLHNHLSGAVTTEFLIELAAGDGLCITTDTTTAVPPPCGPGTRPAADAVTDAAFRRQVIQAWSMQDFPADGNGHDHFFATFGKFGEVTWRHPGRMLAEVANTAARQNQFYLETMISPASGQARTLADRVGYDADLDRMHDKLLADGGLDAVVRQARADADATDTEFRAAAHCDTPRPDAACSLRTAGSPRSPAPAALSGCSPRWRSACGWPSATHASSPSTWCSRRTTRSPCATTACTCAC